VRTTVRLEYGQCPSCTGDALIETAHLLSVDGTPPRIRINRIECTNERCLHYRSILQPLSAGPR
jgi:hypothetical protein